MQSCRSCPSCRKAWPAERMVCPDCLVDLVDDLNARIRCRHCGRDWPATMASCPVCLAELRLDPEVVAKAVADILALGGRMFRPDGTPPFADGPECTLLRLSGRGHLVFTGPTGLVEAAVESPGGQALPPLTCRDHDGTVLFRLLAYDAAAHALVAVDADGSPLATYLRAGVGIEVRDETSAPVASVRPGSGMWELVETGGGVLATLGSGEEEIEGWVDDQWSLELAPAIRRLPLRPLAAVALVLAAKVLLGRPWPAQLPKAEPPAGGWPSD